MPAMTDQHRVIRVPRAVDELETELNTHALEGYEWVARMMVGHVAAMVLNSPIEEHFV